MSIVKFLRTAFFLQNCGGWYILPEIFQVASQKNLPTEVQSAIKQLKTFQINYKDSILVSLFRQDTKDTGLSKLRAHGSLRN